MDSSHGPTAHKGSKATDKDILIMSQLSFGGHGLTWGAYYCG